MGVSNSAGVLGLTLSPSLLYPPALPSQLSPISSFQFAQVQDLGSSLISLFLTHLALSSSENSLGSVYKIYPESDHFSSLLLLTSWSEHPSSSTWIIMTAS